MQSTQSPKDTLPTGIKVGENAPDFTLKNQSGEDISLYELIQKSKLVLLVFYPKDMTPGCTTQLCGIRDIYQELTQRGCSIVGINKGDSTSHSQFITTGNFQFDLLVDTDNVVTKQYCAMKLFFKNIIPKRGVVLINQLGKVVFVHWGQPDTTKILDVIDKISNQ